MRKLFAVVLLSLVACGMIFANGAPETGKAAGETVLTWVNHTQEENGIKCQDAIIAAFEAENPGIKIDVMRMGYDNYIETLQTKFASDDAPDIYDVEGPYIQKYVDNGYASPLTKLNVDDCYDEGALDQLTASDGNVYALPATADIMCVTYNKDVFEKSGVAEPPKTLDGFYDACRKIKDAGFTPIGAPYAESWCVTADVQTDADASALLKDPNMLVDLMARKQTFADSEYRGIFERLKERQKYCNKDAFGTDWNTVLTDIASGKTAMTLNGNWTEDGVLAINPDAKLGVFAFPATNDSKDTLLPVQGGSSGLALYPGKNLEAAEKFAKFYCSEKVAKIYSEMINSICIIKGATADNAGGGKTDILKLMESGASRSLGKTNHNFTKEFRDAVETITSEFILNDMSVDDALGKLDAEFDRIAGK